MHKSTLNIGVAATALLFASTSAFAAPIILENEFIRTAVSDDGTLGFGSSTAPGILHDPTGMGDFSLNDDYLTPGTPYEQFQIKGNSASGSFFDLQNANSGGDEFTQVSITDLSGTDGKDQFVRWIGENVGNGIQVQHDVFFNAGDEQIVIETTVTALDDLTNLRFGRALDPDPDVNRFGSFSTQNQRGLDLPGIDDDIAPEDIVLATGSSSGQTIGLFSDDSTPHNTDIGDGSWTSDPDIILSPANTPDSSVGDDSIGLAFTLGDLAADQSITFGYAYVLGGTVDTVDTGGPTPPPPPPPPPPPTGIPEPASLALLGAGLAGLGLARRRKIKL